MARRTRHLLGVLPKPLLPGRARPLGQERGDLERGAVQGVPGQGEGVHEVLLHGWDQDEQLEEGVSGHEAT